MKNFNTLFIVGLLLWHCPIFAQQHTGGDAPALQFPDGGEQFTQDFNPQLGVVPFDSNTFPPTLPPSTTPPPNDERKVYWVHGLDGNKGTWSKAAEASEHFEFNRNGFAARMLQSYKAEYTESGSLLNAADDLREYIDGIVIATEQHENPDNPPNFNFFIAHSQGGLVSKSLIYEDFCGNPRPADSRYYGGLVTFGSPLNGAQIVNSLESGAVDDFVNAFCTELTIGFVEDIPFIIDFFVEEADIQMALCEVFNALILPSVLSSVSGAETLENYAVGSEYLDLINECEAAPIQKVAFYGDEPQEDIFWRTAQHFMTSVNSQDHWQANDDEELAEQVSQQKLKYYENMAEQQYILNSLFFEGYPCNWWAWITNPFECAIYDARYWVARDARDAYRRGYDWLNNVNEQWQSLIGALSVQTNEVTIAYHCACSTNEGDLYEYPVDNAEDCPNTCDLIPGQTISVNVLVTEPNDGVVLKSSASYMTGATWDPVRLPNSSHMQMRNDENTKDKLTNLYNGAYGDFFLTDSRPE